jgi:hypothetical protein
MLPGTGFSESSILDAPDGRPRFAGTRGGAKIYAAAFEQRGYTGFNETMPTSLLLNDTADQLNDDFKKPLENRLVKETRLVRMDFGGGLKSLEPDIHPNSTSRHLPGKGPTNHFVEYPDSLKLNHKFADHLLSTASVKLDSQIDQSFAELTKYYQPIVLAKWAHHAMPDKFDGKHLENVTVEQIQDTFKDRMKARQVSLEEYGLQIKLGLLIEQDKTKGIFSHPYKFQNDAAKQEFQKLVAEHPK